MLSIVRRELRPSSRWLPVLVLAGLLLYGLVASLALSAPRLPRLLANWNGPAWQVRPPVILYTGDGSGRLGGFDGTGLVHPGHLKWASWTQTEATGSGADWLDDRGTVTAHKVTVRAFRPVNGHFTRLTLRYRYRGKRIVDRRGVWRTGSFWSYYIIGH